MDIQDEVNNFQIEENINFEEEIHLGKEKYETLNVEQKIIVERALKAVKDYIKEHCNCIYVDGPGGSGKTFIYNTLGHIFRSKGNSILHYKRAESLKFLHCSSGLSNFCPCSVYYFSCYPVETTKTIACVHWNILMPAPTFAARVLVVGGAGIKYIYK